MKQSGRAAQSRSKHRLCRSTLRLLPELLPAPYRKTLQARLSPLRLLFELRRLLLISQFFRKANCIENPTVTLVREAKLSRIFEWPIQLAICVVLLLTGCGGSAAAPPGPAPSGPGTGGSGGPLGVYLLAGDLTPVRDPSIIRQGSTYYVFSTDDNPTQGGYLPIRCSTDKVNWNACGFVFNTLPSWIGTTVPGAKELWAPDISYFNGLYHLYYAASVFGTNTSAIGLATTPTLDQTDPSYHWTDHGEVLVSSTSSNFNAIDPNILVDPSGSVWLTYGSYWTGIYQQEIDPASGMIKPGSSIYHLAERAPSVGGDPIEGSSLVFASGYYYLFVSWDYCCKPNYLQDNYKIAVGRSTSPNGPFLDQTGTDMVAGGGTILLQGNGTWGAPGGETAYIDPTGGDLIVFHALNLSQNGLHYLFVNPLGWSNGWPVIEQQKAAQ